jgi:hypothetical protein
LFDIPRALKIGRASVFRVLAADQIAAQSVDKLAADGGGVFCRKDCSMEYAVTAAFLLSVVAGSFAAVVLGGYGIAQLIASAL